MGWDDSWWFRNISFFIDTFRLGISEEKIFIVGVLHSQKRQLTARIKDKLRISRWQISGCWCFRGGSGEWNLGLLGPSRCRPQCRGSSCAPHVSAFPLSDKCRPAWRVHRDPHRHLSLCSSGCRYLRAGLGSKVRLTNLVSLTVFWICGYRRNFGQLQKQEQQQQNPDKSCHF